MIEEITLRDYFIAHAPVEPWDWFEPIMSPMPESIPVPHFYGVCSQDPVYIKYTKDMTNHRIEMKRWEKEKGRQRFIQWPAFWADTMMEARNR